jgi:hypothetical protein
VGYRCTDLVTTCDGNPGALVFVSAAPRCCWGGRGRTNDAARASAALAPAGFAPRARCLCLADARNSGEGPARPRRCADTVVRASLDVHTSARARQKGFRFGLLTTLRCGCAQRVRVSWTRRAVLVMPLSVWRTQLPAHRAVELVARQGKTVRTNLLRATSSTMMKSEYKV